MKLKKKQGELTSSSQLVTIVAVVVILVIVIIWLARQSGILDAILE